MKITNVMLCLMFFMSFSVFSADNNACSEYYFNGMGKNERTTEQFDNCIAQANKGYSAAQAYLGYMYLWGDGVEQDQSKARTLLGLSADQGNTFALNNLAHLAELDGNIKEAVTLYQKSCDKGDRAACSMVKKLSEE